MQDRREHVLRTERAVDRQIILPQKFHHRVARLLLAEPEGRRRADHHSHPDGHGGAVAHREAAAGLDPVAERVAKIEQLPLPAQPVLASPVQIPRSEPAAQQRIELPKPSPAPAPAPVPAPGPEPKPEPKPAPAPVPAPVQEAPAQQELPVPERPFRIIGEALHTYIIVEQGEAVLFIDKHAAHERIRFEALKKEDHPIMAQLLLAPVSAELSREEAAAVLENRALLERCGFEAEDFGGGDVLIRQIPSDVDVEDAKALLQELAGKLLAGKTLDPNGLRDELLHSIACKSAIKAGWQTSDEELRRLVQEVLTRDDIKYCPHGRPVCVTLTKRQLEKQFKRV